jgi:aminoglycoside phosphotransferase (APT) family kinase protein
LAVPVPVRHGRPSSLFPWPWSINSWIEGQRWFDAPPSNLEQAAGDVGRFLAAVHQPAPVDAPRNRYRGVPLADRTALTVEALQTLSSDPTIDIAGAREVWTKGLDAPRWEGEPLWLHGDMHPLNVLVHDDRLVAVIDFGDITAGDPACDLVVAWMALPVAHHATFRAALGPYAQGSGGDALWRRGRGWAVSIAVSILSSAGSDPTFRALGEATLSRALADTV